jgi:ketosteroid isomerase-like protein
MTNLDRAKSYFSAIEARADVNSYFAGDVVQREFPNRLLPRGATRDLAALNEARERGRHAVQGERYEIVNAVEQGDRLALEVIWSATLLVAVGSIPVGGTLRAHFGVFLHYREGLIAAQHNYDCFDPF